MTDINGPSAIRDAYGRARRDGLRARDAAERAGATEGAVVEAYARQPDEALLAAVPLRAAWVELLAGLEACGPVLALTRNDAVVHEKTGVYRHVSANAQDIGLVLAGDIDLRLFLKHWHAGYAVREPARAGFDGPALSLQFFDEHGAAVHKVHLRAQTERAAFEALSQRFAAPGLRHTFTPEPPPEAPRPDAEIDAQELLRRWSELRDTHDFFGMLKDLGADRRQALRLAERRFTHRADASAVRALLERAAASSLAIMVFVGSRGCIQIHTGPVANVAPYPAPEGPWINVMDPGFNLHLREDRLGEVWIVEKPTSDGRVTSVEAFDREGRLMAMFFGARKPGRPELDGWRALVADLPRAAQALAA